MTGFKQGVTFLFIKFLYSFLCTINDVLFLWHVAQSCWNHISSLFLTKAYTFSSMFWYCPLTVTISLFKFLMKNGMKTCSEVTSHQIMHLYTHNSHWCIVLLFYFLQIAIFLIHKTAEVKVHLIRQNWIVNTFVFILTQLLKNLLHNLVFTDDLEVNIAGFSLIFSHIYSMFASILTGIQAEVTDRTLLLKMEYMIKH